ncbi:MAG: hypothetical protein KJ645_00010, partial [Planctomycetes bacterium]|nr:hypothetical protein [Planctomycetota bacterium]
PYHWDRESGSLSMVIRTHGDRVFALKVDSEKNNRRGQKLRVFKVAGPRVAKKDDAIIEERIRWCFRLDEDFSPFQKQCARTEHLAWVHRFGLGAFLRNADPFEEFAKLLITTNISWAGTLNINRHLLKTMGRPIGGPGSPYVAFPQAATVASQSEEFLRKEVRLGYRAPYLLALARAFTEGAIDIKAFLNPDRSVDDLSRSLRTLKGFGPYAVQALLMTFNRYETLILDSWIRKMVSKRHFKNRKISDQAIRKKYKSWGSHAGLACWFECAYDTWIKKELDGTQVNGER